MNIFSSYKHLNNISEPNYKFFTLFKIILFILIAFKYTLLKNAVRATRNKLDKGPTSQGFQQKFPYRVLSKSTFRSKNDFSF